MPEQNTNRLWFVLFTVMIGALLIFGYNDGARATAQNIFDHLNGLLTGDVISADEREDLELVTDEDGNSYVELNEGHFASKNKVSVWLKVVKVMNRDNPDEITGWEIVDAGTSIDNIKSGNGSTSINDAGISDIDFNITIGGLPVISIGNGAFKDADMAGTIDLGDIISVGSDAFDGSHFEGELSSDKLTTIGSNTFPNSNFTTVDTPNLIIVGDGNDSSIKVKDDNGASGNTSPDKDIDQNTSSELNDKGDAIYANIRRGYKEGSVSYGDVWVELVKDGSGWLINNSGNAKGVLTNGANLSGEISFNILIDGLPIIRIADSAFEKSIFTGQFYGDYLLGVGSNAFSQSEFKGSVFLPNVTKLGSNVFRNSKFTGFFEANNLIDIGSYAFANSLFTDGFYANKLGKIYVGTFPKASFSEQISPWLFVVLQDNGNLKNVPRQYDVYGNIQVEQDGNHAVVNIRPEYTENFTIHPDIFVDVTYDNDIAGWIINNASTTLDTKGALNGHIINATGDISFDQTINGVPIKVVKNSVFSLALFDGMFYGANLVSIDSRSFEQSRFSNSANLANAVTIGSYAFANSRFTGDLIIPKLKTLNEYTFSKSVFDKKIDANVLYSVSANAVPLAAFTTQIAPNLTLVGKNNGNLVPIVPEYDIDGDVATELYKNNTVANIRPAYSENGVVYSDIWVNLTKNTNGWVITNAGTTKDYAVSTTDITSANIKRGTISFNQTIDGLPIVGVKSSVFEYAAFSGEFYGDNLETIGQYTFKSSVFTGSLKLPNAISVAAYSFSNSTFTGDLYIPKLQVLNNVFGSSPKVGFKGKLTANVLVTVYENTLTNNTNFSDMYLPNLKLSYAGNGNVISVRDYDVNGAITSESYKNKIIANIRPAYNDNGTVYSDIWVQLTKKTNGWIITNAGSTKDYAVSTTDITSANIKRGTISFNQTIDGLPIVGVNSSVFEYAAFSGEFYGDNLETIGQYTFKSSVFTGSLKLPNATSVAVSSFSNSTFTGDLYIPKLQVLNNVFSTSISSPKVAFTGELSANVLTTVYENALSNNTQFSKQYAPNLTTIGTNNGNLKQSN